MSCTNPNISDQYEVFQARIYSIVYVFFEMSLLRAMQISEHRETQVDSEIMRLGLLYELVHTDALIQRFQPFLQAYLLQDFGEDFSDAYVLANELMITYTFTLRMIQSGRHSEFQRRFLQCVMNLTDLESLCNMDLTRVDWNTLPRKERFMNLMDLDTLFLQELNELQWTPSTDIEHIIFSAIQNHL
jgi:hypothetical protein